MVRAALAGLLGILVLAGCGAGENDADGATPSSDQTSDTPEPPPPPPPPPGNGRCYRLSEQQAAAAHSSAEAVPCGSAHTTTTYLVGKLLDRVVEQSDSIDSSAISTTVDRRCAETFAGYVGGDQDTRTLARLRSVWFVPTEEEFARGADWFRCDLLADREDGTPARLPASTKGMLNADDALDTWGTCDQAGEELNAESDWRLCGLPHNWRAVSVVPVGEGDTPWPGADALQDRGSDCESAVRDYLDDSTGALEFRWSYPTRVQWDAGRRFGLCWTRDD